MLGHTVDVDRGARNSFFPFKTLRIDISHQFPYLQFFNAHAIVHCIAVLIFPMSSMLVHIASASPCMSRFARIPYAVLHIMAVQSSDEL